MTFGFLFVLSQGAVLVNGLNECQTLYLQSWLSLAKLNWLIISILLAIFSFYFLFFKSNFEFKFHYEYEVFYWAQFSF